MYAVVRLNLSLFGFQNPDGLFRTDVKSNIVQHQPNIARMAAQWKFENYPTPHGQTQYHDGLSGVECRLW